MFEMGIGIFFPGLDFKLLKAENRPRIHKFLTLNKKIRINNISSNTKIKLKKENWTESC